MIVNRIMRFHQQPSTASDDLVFFSDGDDMEESGIVAVFSRWAGHRKNLEWAAEVEYFDIVEDEDANGG